MLEPIVNPLKFFRDKIYQFFSSRRDASFELIDSLSSNTQARSVVELSLNSVHRRNYCSITRVVDEFYSPNTEKKKTHDSLTKILTEQCLQPQNRHYNLLSVDCTPNPRKHAPTQKDRSFVYAPSVISGNKPITIGHQYSVVTFMPEKETDNAAPWVVPLSCHRVATSEKGTAVGMKQLSDCINAQTEFKDKLCVSVGDSAYSNPESIFEANKNENQVHISRLRSNRVLHYPVKKENNSDKKRGRKKCYGDAFRLNDAKKHNDADEFIEFEIVSKKGKKQFVKISCWNNIIMRGKRDANISDCTMRLVRICVYKESGSPLFKKPLWLSIVGKRYFELSLRDIFDCYRQRFDIEHFFRFGKNKLLLDKAQTPELEHEEAWWQICMIAYTQLYLARNLANNVPTPWGKYLKSNDSMSPTQVQKDFGRIIRLIGTPAKPPKRRKKAPGRQKGDVQPKRTRHQIVMKQKTAQPVAVSP